MKFSELKELNKNRFVVTQNNNGSWDLSHKDSDSSYVCKRLNVREFSTVEAIVTTLQRAGLNEFTLAFYFKH